MALVLNRNRIDNHNAVPVLHGVVLEFLDWRRQPYMAALASWQGHPHPEILKETSSESLCSCVFLWKDGVRRTECRKVRRRHFLVELSWQEGDITTATQLKGPSTLKPMYEAKEQFRQECGQRFCKPWFSSNTSTNQVTRRTKLFNTQDRMEE